VDALEAEPEGSPEREVVEPDQPVDREAGASVVPGRPPEEPAKQPAAHVLDAEDPDSVRGGTDGDRPVPKTIVHRLEQRLREAVDGDVEGVARTPPTGVGEHVQGVEGPAREPVREETEERRLHDALQSRSIVDGPGSARKARTERGTR